jgi:phosphoribosylaminoimidazole-succinocarboxamide synthase
MFVVHTNLMHIAGSNCNMEALVSTDFSFKGQKGFYRGKVRDVYNINDKYLAMVACDRISAFDVVLPNPIPFKGQVLNQIAAHFLNLTKNIVPNWLVSSPDPNVSIGHFCEPYKVEMVIRGYLAGHAWREYKSGKREICGVTMPEGMKENDPFPNPIITPTIKASEGHDEDISREGIFELGLVKEEEYLLLEDYTRKLFAFGSEYAKNQGLILVDTKYEFGMLDGRVVLMDEIHTPDSSRYFYADTYEEIQAKDQQQRQLSKEFVRQWLIENGFQGKEGQTPPTFSEDFIQLVSQRYIELYEKITAKTFIRQDYSDVNNRVEKSIHNSIEKLA